VVVEVLRWVGGWFGVHRPPNRAGCRPWERTGPTQFGRAMTPGGEEKTPPGRGPGTSTGSGMHARFAAPARSTARCSRWRRNGGGGACVPLSVDGEALLVHNRTRPRPYIAHRADHRPEGPRSTKGMAQATTPGQGTPRGCGPVSYLAAGDTGELVGLGEGLGEHAQAGCGVAAHGDLVHGAEGHAAGTAIEVNPVIMLAAPVPVSMAASIRRSARRPPGSADAGGHGAAAFRCEGCCPGLPGVALRHQAMSSVQDTRAQSCGEPVV
jgi:hypothetical protein